jgi:C4-type Zn-finger protein
LPWLEDTKGWRPVLLLKKIQLAREGNLRFTLMLKDPFRITTVISLKGKKRRISVRELKGIKFGEQAVAARLEAISESGKTSDRK